VVRLFGAIAAGLCLILTAGCAEAGIPAAKPADTVLNPRIVVKKAERTLALYDGEKLVAVYPIGLGFTPEGHKKREGDGATPEGEYTICTRNEKSKFYKSLGLSYPNAEDAEAGLADGLIDEATYKRIVKSIEDMQCPPWNTPLGGEIFIHGHGAGSDWTAGCIALGDADMEALWQRCQIGTPVTIYP